MRRTCISKATICYEPIYKQIEIFLSGGDSTKMTLKELTLGKMGQALIEHYLSKSWEWLLLALHCITEVHLQI